MARRANPRYNFVLPVDSSGIPGFEKWVKLNPKEAHDIYVFGAYLDEAGKCVVGMPERTKVRAVGDGTVRSSYGGDDTPGKLETHRGFVIIDHKQPGARFSAYYDMIPSVGDGEEVKRGTVIGHMFKGQGKGDFAYLRFQLGRGTDRHDTFIRGPVDPEGVFGEITDLFAEPPMSATATIR